jgi:hypothetical protein
MFYRYAVNIRHGFGISWNPNGVHTYGQTSALWCLAVLGLSFLPCSMSTGLLLGSWICAMGGLTAMAWAVARNASSMWLSSVLHALPWVIGPIAAFHIYASNSTTGMETMLAALLAAVFVGLALLWQQGSVHASWVGIVALLLFLTRPESLIASCLMVLVLQVLVGGATRRSLVVILWIIGLGVAADLSFCKLYFGTVFPLSFYVKSVHGYEGYQRNWLPMTGCWHMLGACSVYFAAIMLVSGCKDWRLVISCLLPAFAVFVYLTRVVQIMGINSRYYVPYFAFFVVPGLLAADRWLSSGKNWLSVLSFPRVIATAALIAMLNGPLASRIALAADRRLTQRPYIYDDVVLQTSAKEHLPLVGEWFRSQQVADTLVSRLPPGASIAATEVGYLGARAPQITVIDLAGLNEREIALHGFKVDDLLARKPDLIWMPHTDYKYQRGLLLSDPRLLQEYDVYAEAATFGIAIRKDSPYRSSVMQQMRVLWDRLYPGYDMRDYFVRSASWSAHKHLATFEEQPK